MASRNAREYGSFMHKVSQVVRLFSHPFVADNQIGNGRADLLLRPLMELKNFKCFQLLRTTAYPCFDVDMMQSTGLTVFACFCFDAFKGVSLSFIIGSSASPRRQERNRDFFSHFHVLVENYFCDSDLPAVVTFLRACPQLKEFTTTGYG